MSENSAATTVGNLSLQHMRWANQELLRKLAELPDECLALHANHDDWNVARIAHHLVAVSGRLHARIAGQPVLPDPTMPETMEDIPVLAHFAYKNDVALIDDAQQPDSISTFTIFNREISQPRSLVLTQAIHHAQEHRVQIVGILASHGHHEINLDELSLWYFAKVLP